MRAKKEAMGNRTEHRRRHGCASRPRTGLLALVVTGSIALVAVACGGGDGTGAASEAETADVGVPRDETAAGAGSDGQEAQGDAVEGETDGRSDPSADEDESGDPADEPESLADFLGVAGGFGFGSDPEEQRAQYTRQEQRVQELIAECMAQEGFEYIPAVRPIPDAAFRGFDSEEFAREQGFGVTTTFGDTGPGFLDVDDWTDPNQAIVDALSESERQAYYDTLYQPAAFPDAGNDGDFASSGSSSASASTSVTGEIDSDTVEEAEIYGAFGSGCSDRAYAEVYALEDFEELYEQLDLESMYERIEADPRSQAMFEEWSQCMADRGYDYPSPETMYESVYTDFQARLEEIGGSPGGFLDPFEGLSDEEIEELFTNLSPEEVNDLYLQAQQEAAQNVDQDALAALQAEERALAVANAQCTADMQQQIEELTREYETALINDNRALLEQYRASQRG